MISIRNTPDSEAHIIIHSIKRKYLLKDADWEYIQNNLGKPMRLISVNFVDSNKISYVGFMASGLAFIYEDNIVDCDIMFPHVFEGGKPIE